MDAAVAATVPSPSAEKEANDTPPLPSASQVHIPSTLEHCRVRSLPPSVYYIADFISEEEERAILHKTWPSDLVKNTLLDSNPLPDWLEQPVVSRLLSIPISDDEPNNVFTASPHGKPNHVLVNEYPPNTGIMPHKDGAAYYPVVCTVSLGSSLCLNLYRSKEDGALDPEPVWRILQEPRSLLITTEELYSDYLHGIDSVSADVNLSTETVANWTLLRSPSLYKDGHHERQTRVSLTYRDVLKVSKLGSKLGAMFKRP